MGLFAVAQTPSSKGHRSLKAAQKRAVRQGTHRRHAGLQL
jgi:hypothetical protein